MLDKLAMDRVREMRFQYPHLSLSQIYAALSFYHDHQEIFEAEIERQLAEYERLAAASGDSPARRRLRRGEIAVSLKLYMDVHVRRAVTSGLRLREVDVLTAQDDGTTHSQTTGCWTARRSWGAVLFSQDHDLLAEATKRQRTGIHFAGVIYAHQLGITIGRCIDALELMAKLVEPRI